MLQVHRTASRRGGGGGCAAWLALEAAIAVGFSASWQMACCVTSAMSMLRHCGGRTFGAFSAINNCCELHAGCCQCSSGER